MSTIARHHKPVSLGPAAGATAAGPARTTLLVRWTIAASSLERSPLPAVGSADPDAQAHLEWSISIGQQGSARAAACLRLGDRSATLATDSPATIAHDASGFTHVIIPGLLSVVFDDRCEPRRLLYAATPLLSRLGVPGGRTDPPTMG